MTKLHRTHKLNKATLADLLRSPHLVSAPDVPQGWEQQAVRSVVLSNVLNGRVAGLIHYERVADVRAWLEQYAGRVRRYFASERGVWRALLDGASGVDDALFEKVCASVDAVFHAVRARFRATDVQREELVHDVYLALRASDGLSRYSFDTSLTLWIRDYVWRRAKRLYSPARIDPRLVRIVGDVAQDDLDPARQDDLISIDQSMTVLIETDQRVLREMLAGVPAPTTAARLGVSLATVYSRRKRIVTQLHALLVQ